jgi:hypothetical protein
MIYSKRSGSVPAPAGAIYVGRPTVWGNPYAVEDWGQGSAANLFYGYALDRMKREPNWLKPLVGKSLVCWCKSKPTDSKPCHAEWLQSLANSQPNQFRESKDLETIQGNLFDYPIIVIPTNGIVGRNGLVMGAGVALTAKNLCPVLPKVWGAHVQQNGNIPCKYYSKQLDKTFISFPTKENYSSMSTYELIGESAWYLRRLADENLLGVQKVYLPAVGAGLGGLDFNLVKSILNLFLDDRFIIVLGGK